MANFDMESLLRSRSLSHHAALLCKGSVTWRDKEQVRGGKTKKTLGTPWPRVEEFLTGIDKCSGQHCYVLKTAWFALTSPIACTKRSQSSRELSGRMIGGGFISGHDSLGTSSSWGRNSSSLARWRSRRNENGNVKFTLTKTNVHRSRWWGKMPHHKTGPSLRKWFKQFQHLENNGSKSQDTGTTFKYLNILQQWKWVSSSWKIRLEFRRSLGSALVQSASGKERGLVYRTAASNRAYINIGSAQTSRQ